MAQKVNVVLIDDTNGQPADETVLFGLDGVTYEIDLSSTNAAQLRDALSTWVASGRKVRRGATPRRASSAGAGDTAAIREWARANGYQVSDRGRVSAEIRDAYAQAN